jgi:hypothetical protein
MPRSEIIAILTDPDNRFGRGLAELNMEREREREGIEPTAGDDDDPEGRENWFMYQRQYPFDQVPEGARRLALEEARERLMVYGPDARRRLFQITADLPLAA